MRLNIQHVSVGVVAVVFGFGLAGCGGPKAYVRSGFLEHPPKRVAVLPFAITYPYDVTTAQDIPESHLTGREVFRKTFYYAFTPYGYGDVQLADVDARLASAFGPIEAEAWRSATPKAVGEVLGVDALIYGDISRLVHLSTPLYTETSLKANLRMVDAASGEVLWRKSVGAAERGGALMKKGQVVDFVKDQLRSFTPKVKLLRVADVAVRQALKDFPNPPLSMEMPAAATHDEAAGLRLAVLPLETKRKGWAPIATKLRAHVAAALQESPFDLVELQRIDGVLKAHGWQEGESVSEAAALGEVAEALDADLLLRGTVTKWGRSYLIVQSWVTAGMKLELIDPISGEVIWAQERANRRHAGILKGPTGYKSIATSPITGLKGSHLERVGQHLARAMAEDLSRAPAVLAYASERVAPKLAGGAGPSTLPTTGQAQ